MRAKARRENVHVREEFGLRHRGAKTVETVPPHGRSQRNLIEEIHERGALRQTAGCPRMPRGFKTNANPYRVFPSPAHTRAILSGLECVGVQVFPTEVPRARSPAAER